MPNQKSLPCRGGVHAQGHVAKHDSEENEVQSNASGGAGGHQPVIKPPHSDGARDWFSILLQRSEPNVITRCFSGERTTTIDRWLVERQLDPGMVTVGRLAEALGTADFIVRGETITALEQPHRFYLLRPF